MKVTPTSNIRTNCYYQDSHFNFLFFPSSAMAASSSQSETMKAQCSVDNPKVHSFFLNSLCFIPIVLYTVCHWRELYDYLVMCPKLNIKSCQMLCENCFHQENRKLHAMASVMSLWCIRERWKSIMEWILHLAHLFVCLEGYWYAWLIPICWGMRVVRKLGYSTPINLV